MSQFRTSRVFDIFFIVMLIIGLSLAYQNKVAISDWAFFLHNQPPAETIHLADDAGLSDYGRKLLYRTNPQVTTNAEIANHCDVENLGCITPSGTVYILASESHDGVAVTAAHEMLHMAYRRLNKDQKAQLAPLLNQAINQINSSFLQQELSGQPDEAAKLDEAHSVLGTEYPNLPQPLEDYYKQYFADRSKVVAAEQRSM